MSNLPSFSNAPLALTLTLNGHERQLAAEPRTTLLDLLRENLHLTGPKKGCDHGQCGACTVLRAGQRRLSCLALACAHDGAAITTVEGLGTDDELHPVQQAFLAYDAYQCGYCTPGQICSAVGLLQEDHARTRDDVREPMSGNLCRCGAYANISDAILSVLSQPTTA